MTVFIHIIGDLMPWYNFQLRFGKTKRQILWHN